MPVPDELGRLDGLRLAEGVRRVLGKDSVSALAWSLDPIDVGAGRAVYRVRATARAASGRVPWAVILKVKPAAGGGDPRRWDFWQREVAAYESGLLGRARGGLAAPRCLGVEGQPDGTTWLWLEALDEDREPRWTAERFCLAADHVGRFNGALSPERTLRELRALPWLSRRFLRGWVRERVAPVAACALDPARWRSPLVRAAYPRPVTERLRRLWDEREVLLRALERAPQTLCHGDVHRRNLFGRRGEDGQAQTVAVDWECVGFGAVGEDAAGLVATSLLFRDAPAAEPHALAAAVVARYLAGLRAAGWDGSEASVRFAFAAAAALRWGFMASGWPLQVGDDAAGRSWLERVFRRPLEELIPAWARVTYFLLDLADEARALLPSVNGARGSSA